MQSAKALDSVVSSWRRRRRLSLRQLASLSGYSSSAIQRWESGLVVPDEMAIRALMIALEVPPSDWPSKTKETEFLSSDGAAHFVPPGAILRSARGRLNLSLTSAANRLACSEATYRRWESGEREIPPGAIQLAADVLHLSNRERSYLTGSVRFELGPKSSEAVLLRSLGQLRTRVLSGDAQDLDLDFLHLIYIASVKNLSQSESVETLFRVKSGYADYLLWWYRRREALEWVKDLPFRFADRSGLDGWGTVVRAHWHSRWERANNEYDVCSYLHRRLELHSDTPSRVDVETDYAWRLGLTDRADKGIKLIKSVEARLEPVPSARTRIVREIYNCGLQFMLEKSFLAMNRFPALPEDDFQLRVTAATIQARMHAELGDKAAAVAHLAVLRDEVVDRGLTHFADVLNRRIDNGGIYLNRW